MRKRLDHWKRGITRITLALATLGGVLAGSAWSQSGGPYSITTGNIGGGRTSDTAGVYRLGSTIGQPDAVRLTGGAYVVQGGFWTAASIPTVDAPAPDPVPLAFAAPKAFPNPFAVATTLAFELPHATRVRLVIHGIDGRVVRTLADESRDAGRHRAIWDGRDDGGRAVPPGIYWSRLAAGTFVSSHRIVRIP